MIYERRARLILATLLLVATAACERPSQPPTPPAPPVSPTPPAPPAPPAKTYVMVCKSSRTGLKAKCGTPDAVMVGMKPE
jgi:hypothetical protein